MSSVYLIFVSREPSPNKMLGTFGGGTEDERPSLSVSVIVVAVVSNFVAFDEFVEDIEYIGTRVV